MKGSPSYQQFSDEQLMVHIARKDGRAFEELYQRYHKRLLYYFYRMLGQSTEKSQDFLQDLFMKVIEKPHLFDAGRKFSTWCFSIAHNMCKNEYRRQQVRQVVDRESDPDHQTQATPDAAARTDINRFTAELYHELEQLDEEKKTAFLLRHREGFSIREISEVLECSEGTVKSRIFYTNKKLAERLRPYRSLQYQ
ncbi:MAG: RNA polymerase sigma factor [Bacteroidota bacterium]